MKGLHVNGPNFYSEMDKGQEQTLTVINKVLHNFNFMKNGFERYQKGICELSIFLSRDKQSLKRQEQR